MCYTNIIVVPSTTASPIWPPNDRNDNDMKFYTFFQHEEEFPPTLPVSIIPRGGPLTIDKFHVRKGGKWTPVTEWMIQLADSRILETRSVSSATYYWFKRNGKIFRLMDLPVELQLLIFARVIAASGDVYPLQGVEVT
jgi:hypothetical protein